MEFIKEYQEKINQFKVGLQKLIAENEEEQMTYDGLKAQYDGFINQLDYDNANKIKQKMKSVESSIETKADMISVLQQKVTVGDVEAAKDAAKRWYSERQKYVRDLEKLATAAEKKKEEYLEAVRNVRDLNGILTTGAHQLNTLSKITNWRDRDVVKEIGFDLTTEAGHSASGQIPLYKFLIRNLEQLN